MVQTIRETYPVARKPHRCGMCNRPIQVGTKHSARVNVYDGRIYTWRECIHCHFAVIVNYVHAWTGGWHDEGVGYEEAADWASEAVEWPRYWTGRSGCYPITAYERGLARGWLARAAGGEGE